MPDRSDGRNAPAGWGGCSPFSYWNLAPAAWDIWLAAAASREEIAALAARRFAELVQFARDRSAYYAGLYRALPAAGIQPCDVPPVTRRALMERFDDWVTDPEVTRESAGAFVADPERVGRPYLGRYAVWTSSGSTGEPGLFVHDAHSLAVHDALEMLRMGRGPLAPGFPGGSLLAGGRYAMVGATGGHFAGVASVERMRSLAPALADRLRVFSIIEPLPRLVAALNAYQPTHVATYPTVASLLAAEQDAGRLEPVDRDLRPVPPGAASHTVLLTNLANRVQPVIRYDLGDSVTLGTEPCSCGSPFPALRVQGRCDDELWLRNANGEWVELLPLALTTVVEDFAGAHQFQVVQVAPDALRVRLEETDRNARESLWLNVARALRSYLDAQGLPGVALHLDAAPLERSASSGKLRRVVASRRASA